MSVWVFGYGSLIWNPGFDFSETHFAQLDDWELRFWQASNDHRGTPEYPGRVATLIPSPGARVRGRVFRVLGDRDRVLAYLDHREKCGYERHFFQVKADSGEILEALSYVGSQSLESYVGPEDEIRTAAVIRRASGPSGANLEYLRKLHQVHCELGHTEPHVERLLHLAESYPQASP